MFEKKHQNSGTLGKDTINKWIISFLSVGKRGFKSNFDLASIFLLILKRLKTGVQWRELPIESYFEKGEISWQNVYYYFNKWSKDGSFQRVWLNLLSKKKRKLDMSCVQLDGSHTRYADAGFDSKSLREFLESKEIIANIKPNPRNGEQPDVYFDEELYKNRFKIEQANGWLDGYKGLIMRYEYLDVTWIGMLLLGFISKFLKKV